MPKTNLDQRLLKPLGLRTSNNKLKTIGELTVHKETNGKNIVSRFLETVAFLGIKDIKGKEKTLLDLP
jgi:hypothetical protein